MLFLITPSSQKNDDVGVADERFVAYVFVSTSFISSVKIAHSSRTLHRRKFITQMHFSGKWGQPTRLCAPLAAEKKRKLCSLASKNMNLFCTFNENYKKIYEIDNTPRLVWRSCRVGGIGISKSGRWRNHGPKPRSSGKTLELSSVQDSIFAPLLINRHFRRPQFNWITWNWKGTAWRSS